MKRLLVTSSLSRQILVELRGLSLILAKLSAVDCLGTEQAVVAVATPKYSGHRGQ